MGRWLTLDSLSRHDSEDILDVLILQDEESDWTSSDEEDPEFLYIELAFPKRARACHFDWQEFSELDVGGPSDPGFDTSPSSYSQSPSMDDVTDTSGVSCHSDEGVAGLSFGSDFFTDQQNDIHQ